MYPQDLRAIGESLQHIDGSVTIHLSTYTANGGNSQTDIVPLADDYLGGYGFCPVAMTRVNGHMMSLIYTRDVDWSHELKTLGERFTEWLSLYQ